MNRVKYRSLIHLLVAFSLLLFSAPAAVGRTCAGLAVGQSSRYVTMLIPAVFGIYLYFLTRQPGWPRRVALATLVVVLALGWLPMNSGGSVSVPLTPLWYSVHKTEWVSCYLSRENIAECDKLTGFPVYPNPAVTHLQDKLDFMKHNRLGFYALGQ